MFELTVSFSVMRSLLSSVKYSWKNASSSVIMLGIKLDLLVAVGEGGEHLTATISVLYRDFPFEMFGLNTTEVETHTSFLAS